MYFDIQCTVKMKGKVFLVHAMKVRRGSRGTAPLNLTSAPVGQRQFQAAVSPKGALIPIEQEAKWAS